jgi:hypothetical protein
MTLELETLLIALAFLLPGFLASRLIAAKTPAVGRQPSAFEETLESLLRSMSIHLIIAPLVLVIVRFVLLRDDPLLLSRIYSKGLQAYYDTRPVEVSLLLFVWLVAAFLIAIVFGCKWDPIEYVLQRLARGIGALSEDPFYLLQQRVVERRKQGHASCQLWVQARLKNGYTYRGELVVMGYRDEDKSRELLLANVKFFPYPVQATDESCLPPKLYDFAFVDISNCESLEMLITDDTPSQMQKSEQA